MFLLLLLFTRVWEWHFQLPWFIAQNRLETNFTYSDNHFDSLIWTDAEFCIANSHFYWWGGEWENFRIYFYVRLHSKLFAFDFSLMDILVLLQLIRMMQTNWRISKIHKTRKTWTILLLTHRFKRLKLMSKITRICSTFTGCSNTSWFYVNGLSLSIWSKHFIVHTVNEIMCQFYIVNLIY